MSSTTRTRIWSAISLWLVLGGGSLRWVVIGGSGHDGRRTCRSRAPIARLIGSRPTSGREVGDYLGVGAAAGVTVSMSSGGSTPYESTRVLRMMPVVSIGGEVTGAPVIGSMKSSTERRTRLTAPSGAAPVSWAKRMTSSCCGVTARMTICCWPLRVVVGAWQRGWCSGAGRRGRCGRRREQRPDDLHALEQQRGLDARRVQAGHDGDGLVDRIDRDDGERVALEADDHVDVVARLDDRPDARSAGRPGRPCSGGSAGQSMLMIWPVPVDAPSVRRP